MNLISCKSVIISTLISFALLLSCQHTYNSKPQSIKPSFKKVHGTTFFEIRRTFDNGISFNKYGLQLIPEWNIRFMSDSTVQIHSSEKGKYLDYPMYHSHDSVFNFGREWFRIKKVSRDSMILQLLEVRSKKISKQNSNVFMTLYSEYYIRNVLRKDVNALRLPNKKDTLYVSKRALLGSINADSTFAARTPAQFKSKNSNITAEAVKVVPDLINNVSIEDEYLHPRCVIVINNAYKDFNFSLQVLVDTDGKLYFNKFLTAIKEVTPDFYNSKKRIATAIIDGYLQNSLEIRPGETLGTPHLSKMNLVILGRKRNYALNNP